MRGLRVLLLGQGRLELDGQPLTRLMAVKHQALVFYLAATDQPAPRGQLATLLWGDAEESAARGNLRVALTRLRRWLPGVLEIDDRQVAFAAGASVSVDWRDLTQALKPDAPPAAREAAASAWRGPLLDGLDVAGIDEFERWLAQVRQRAQRDALDLRRLLLQSHEDAGALDAAVGHARGLLEIDETDEPAHMALMRLLAARGQRTAALAQYDACRTALAERLGARPSAACYALYTHIHAEPPAAPSPDSSLPAAPANSPADSPADSPAPPAVAVVGQMGTAFTAFATVPALLALPALRALTPVAPLEPLEPPEPLASLTPTVQATLIGRERELALVNERLRDPECRWLTITGPGGVGKTRLATVAATQLAPRLRHGVLWFSGRDAGGALRDGETLAQQVLDHLGTDRHAPGALLLVLDNLETVTGVRALAQLLATRVPGAVVLATSRSRVGGAREWLMEVTGLSLERANGGALASSPAAQMFAASARRLVPGFNADDEAASVERICAQVGGLPLALEMAAHGVHQMGAAAVADRLERDGVLSDPDRDPTDRHHRMEWVLEDSWALLDAPTRAAALRLAWLPDEMDDELLRAVDVNEAAVGALRDHSWLQRRATARVAMHPLQQDFLRRRPGAEPLADAVRAAVARYLVGVMPQVLPFGDLTPADAVRADRLAATAACAAPVITDATAHCLATFSQAELASWIDRVVALLLHAHRQAEAAQVLMQVLTQNLACADVAPWLSTGWRLRRAELLSAECNATAALTGYSQGFKHFGLGDVTTGRADWASLPRALARLWAQRDWPPVGDSRQGFEQLLIRSLFACAVYLTFIPDPMTAARLSVMADALVRRLGRHAELRHLSAAWGWQTFGQASLARRQQRRAQRAHRAHCAPGSHPLAHLDPRLDAFTKEGHAALSVALGQWSALPAELDAAADDWMALRNLRHEVGLRSLGAKLALYQGRLVDAFDRFTHISELSLRRTNEARSAWGPMGQAEAGLYLGQLDDDALQRLFERTSNVMTEMEDVDAAYSLHRQALAARLSWRRGDVHAAREAVLAGCAAAARLRHCGFWAHEAYAGLGDTLLALRRHERKGGGTLPPLNQAWAQLQPALGAHVARFPPARALQARLCGEWARDEGQLAQAETALLRAIALAENQGMRVELARACEVLSELPSHAQLKARAQRLWREMRAGQSEIPGATRREG
jgi:DNA-binding SARP family transcriptional activator